MERKKIPCPNCSKMVSSTNLKKHQKSKKCKNHNDKTDAQGIHPDTSPGNTKESQVASELPSKSNILKQINMKQEFDKMTEKINPKKEAEEKFECGACGKKFNERYGHCPHCGCEFDV